MLQSFQAWDHFGKKPNLYLITCKVVLVNGKGLNAIISCYRRYLYGSLRTYSAISETLIADDCVTSTID